MGIAGGRGQLAVAEQLLDLAQRVLRIVKQERGRAVTQAVGGNHSHPRIYASRFQPGVEELIAHWSPTPPGENQP